MLIDPHVNPHDLSPDELIDLMTDASLDGAVITCTHSARDGLPYVEALEDEDFVALLGVELQTPHGALVFIPHTVDERFLSAQWAPTGDQAITRSYRDEEGEQVDSRPLWRLEPLLAQLSQLQGALLLAHPFSRLSSQSWGDRAYTLAQVCALEARTGRGLPVRDFLADQLAETKGWGRVGSCGGDLSSLGSAVTAFLESADSQRGLCEALSQAICWPVEFEKADHPRPRYQGVVEDEGPRRVSLAEKERKEALAEVNRRRPQKGGAPIDQIFGQGPKRGGPREGRGSERSRR